MGLTSWLGTRPTKEEAVIAKNYLTEKELVALNRIVAAYLEFAELQALNRKPMYMQDWITNLDDFLRRSDYDILNHAGKISHKEAIQKAELEFKTFKKKQLALPSRAEQDFEAAIKQLPGIIKNEES